VPEVNAGNIIDRLILGNPPGTLLVPMCAKEALVLRTLGIRWQRLTTSVTQGYREQMAHPTGFGAVDIKLYLSRKYTEGKIIATQVSEIDIPQDFFEWPLQK